MAQKVSIQLVDDIDGSEATETVLFGLDGSSYEIDLSAQNADNLRKSLDSYTESARIITRGKGKRSGPDPKKVREWARENDIEVSAQGRVPRAIVEAYTAQAVGA